MSKFINRTSGNPSYNKNLSPKVRLYDFLGKYYINLNGVKPNNILEITEPHRKEIVDFVEILIKQELRREIGEIFSKLPSKLDPMSKEEILDKIEEQKEKDE